MPLIALGAVLLIPLVLIALMPLLLIQRYRAGTARRAARGWLTTINLVGVCVSAAFFLVGAAVTSLWVADVFTAALAGLVTGAALGGLGVLLTRWESTSASLHYTPNRWLVMAITLLVAARLFYGLWRSWNAWLATPDASSWLAASGVAGSFAAGAVVIGYYLAYWAGVRRRLGRRARR